MHPALLCPCDRTDPTPWPFALWKSEAAFFLVLFFAKVHSILGSCASPRGVNLQRCANAQWQTGAVTYKPDASRAAGTMRTWTPADWPPCERALLLFSCPCGFIVWKHACVGVRNTKRGVVKSSLPISEGLESKALHFCTRAMILHFLPSSTQKRCVIEKEALFDVMLTFASDIIWGSGGQEVKPLLCARCIWYSSRWDFPQKTSFQT